ncbi:MAG: GlsB/YeaQ/YmgE family stress response membrane protein [Janthinobacterium lividum]
MIGTIIMWLVVGFLAGLLAKAIVPGSAEKPSGFWGTAILGIVGAIVGGFIYYLVSGGNSGFRTHFDIPSILWAALGAVIVVVIERAIAGRRAI